MTLGGDCFFGNSKEILVKGSMGRMSCVTLNIMYTQWYPEKEFIIIFLTYQCKIVKQILTYSHIRLSWKEKEIKMGLFSITKIPKGNEILKMLSHYLKMSTKIFFFGPTSLEKNSLKINKSLKMHELWKNFVKEL